MAPISYAEKQEEEVAPAEDLMREHGLLNRILLIYDYNIRLLKAGKKIDSVQLQKSAKIIRTFIEDYHEKLEEDYIFPKFEKANVEIGLMKTLREQHKAGRALTEIVLKGGKGSELEAALEKFNIMYRPHEAREDTIVFPHFKKLISKSEYKELGEKFEAQEHKLFGKSGFEGVLEEVAAIEKALGIYDLALYTPKF